ncbi:Gfo/Idh/MocA family protein [Paenibacillus protaetiae]|uniref:Gfo/Idh/MocA family oxidoreductase n=1 Tax=Paenibacillus protaetiae TaxID=2509456 RepID=A0A4P6F0I0_9BACL|nr:Gfo/Idh/MocA family oxidoreductase [Paenibacillus protaetiae]QAY67599.1 Gfo/Idh/MocA family oxidoreductase [Paenibacillus protaetiae]
MNKPIAFSIVGGAGFRAQYFLRIAEALPEWFRVSGLVVRDSVKGQAMKERWRVPVYASLEELLEREHSDFAVLAVSPSVAAGYMEQLAERGVPILAETPPAGTLEELLALNETMARLGAKIQIAEQYQFHPIQQARLAVMESGRIGAVSQTTVSISHYYHAVSLIRQMLGVRFEDVRVQAMQFDSEWVAGPDRSGPPKEDKLAKSERVLAWLTFEGNKLGIYDFTKDQHRSWTRFNHLNVRGERGEISDNRITAQDQACRQVRIDLKRINKGEYENQEGYFLQGIMAGDQWVYENPFAPGRLYDDEIAIAACLLKMGQYAAGGSSFYSLAEASQDCYIGWLIEEAVRTGETIRSVRQPWSEAGISR